MTLTAQENLATGVSVIVRTSYGVGRILATLRSLRAQTLDKSLYEVLVIPNGPDDGTRALVREYQRRHRDLDLRVIATTERGIGSSFNLGLFAARREFVTVVDDDDCASEEFLEALFAHADRDVIAHGYLANLDADGTGIPDFDTYVNRSVSNAIGRTVHPREVPSSLAFNTAKLLWTAYARQTPAREDLRLATDVVFWHTVANTFKLDIRVVPSESRAFYYRSLRLGSHSRPVEATWEVEVLARLAAVEALWPFARDRAQYVHQVARSSVAAQVGAIGRYLRYHPDEHGRVVAEVTARRLEGFPYQRLNKGRAKDLVTAYSFLPSTTTSAMVAARRIRARGVCVDVVSNEAGKSTLSGNPAAAVVTPFIGNHALLRGRAVFAQWASVAEFCHDGMAAIEDWEQTQGHYRSVYSRVMWPHSHVLAALYKVRRPEARWIAEFSDPLASDVHGKPRKGKRGDDALTAELEKAILDSGLPLLGEGQLLAWIEHLAYTLADEIVFTNANQKRVMLEHIVDPGVRARVEGRAVVAHHPTLPADFYSLADVTYPLPEGKVHLAYFGIFYPTRGLTEVISAIEALPAAHRDKLMVHVFTSDPTDLRNELKRAGLSDTVVANGYVPYLDFLALTTRFDCLLVNDARTLDTHSVNPYLPSKLSDYRGSGTPIWAISEPGSVLSQQDTAYQSELGDAEGALRVLQDLTSAAVSTG